MMKPRWWLVVRWRNEQEEPLLVVGPFAAGPPLDTAIDRIVAIDDGLYAVDLVNVAHPGEDPALVDPDGVFMDSVVDELRRVAAA